MDGEEKLWKIFSEVLTSNGLNAEDYREDFKEEYESMKNENPEFQGRAIRTLANMLIDQGPKRPKPPMLDAMQQALKIEEELDKAKLHVDPADRDSVEQYLLQVEKAKREKERIFWEAELKKAEIKAEGLRKEGTKVISSICLKCGLPLKGIIDLRRGLCSNCYNRL